MGLLLVLLVVGLSVVYCEPTMEQENGDKFKKLSDQVGHHYIENEDVTHKLKGTVNSVNVMREMVPSLEEKASNVIQANMTKETAPRADEIHQFPSLVHHMQDVIVDDHIKRQGNDQVKRKLLDQVGAFTERVEQINYEVKNEDVSKKTTEEETEKIKIQSPLKDRLKTETIEKRTSGTPSYGSNWMENISDDTKLSMLAIPGTHNSGSYRTLLLIETQDWTIDQQLRNGIRFLDIRLSNKFSILDDFEIRHGIAQLGSFRNLVMDRVNDFLTNHPRETILMSIKGPLDVERLERMFFRNLTYHFYLGPITPDTPLQIVRGKIVVFRRYEGGNDTIGIEWDTYHQFSIQDEFKLKAKCKLGICGPWFGIDLLRKASRVKKYLIDAAYGNCLFYVNFASANYYGTHIRSSGKVCNDAVFKYFNSIYYHGYSKPVGTIVVMDYPSRGVIDRIVRNNFNRKPFPTIDCRNLFRPLEVNVKVIGDGWGWSGVCLPVSLFVLLFFIKKIQAKVRKKCIHQYGGDGES